MKFSIGSALKLCGFFGMGFMLSGCKTGFNNIGNGGDLIGDGIDYIGPGYYVLELDQDDDDFRFTRYEAPSREDSIFQLTGTRVEATSGYTLLTVEESEGLTSIREGDNFVILESDDLVTHFVSDSGLRPLVKQGRCPSVDRGMLWTILDTNIDADDIINGFFGQMTYNHDDVQVDLDNEYSLEDFDDFDPVDQDRAFSNRQCVDGLVELANHSLFHSDEGSLIVRSDLGNDTDVMLGIPVTELNAFTDLDGAEFVGLMYNRNDPNEEMVSMTCNSEGFNCEIFLVTDEEDGTRASAVYMTLEWDEDQALNRPHDGFIQGTVSREVDNQDDPATGNVICAYNGDANDSGGKLLSCVGQSPAANTRRLNLAFYAAG